MYNLQQNFCLRTYGNWQSGVPKWRIKLNPEKAKVIILSRSPLARKSEPVLKLYGERLKIYPQVKFLGITFDSKLTFQKHFEEILGRCNTGYHCVRLIDDKKWGPSPSTILQIYKFPANFRIWLTFDHNNIEHNHQQNSPAPEQVYPTCPAFAKIHQCKATRWPVWPSLRERYAFSLVQLGH